MQVIQREDNLPTDALRSFLGVVLITACLIRILTVSDGVIESLVLCALVQIAIVFAYYSISDNNEALRRRIRLHLSAVAAIGCAILQSHGGLRVRSLDKRNGVWCRVWGGDARPRNARRRDQFNLFQAGAPIPGGE